LKEDPPIPRSKRPVRHRGVWSASQKLSRSLFGGRLPDFAWKDRKDLTRLGDWAYGLGTRGKPAMLRAAIAAARLALPVFEKRHPKDRRPRRAVDAAASVLERERGNQARGVRAACRAALDAAREAARGDGFEHDLMPGICPAYDAACAANQAAKLAHLILTLKIPRGELEARIMSMPFNFVTSRAVRYAAGAASVRRVRAVVRKTLLAKGGSPIPR
jgi:hypothetical protein